MELGFRKKNRIKNTIGPTSVTHLCLSLPAGLVSVYPQNSFIYMTESVSLDSYILQLQPPKRTNSTLLAAIQNSLGGPISLARIRYPFQSPWGQDYVRTGYLSQET